MGNYKIYVEDVCITDTFNFEYFERVKDLMKRNLKDGIMIRSYVHTINR
jgi:hypothetical protein